MESEKLGIKETKEVVVAANELGAFLVERLKDGVGADDAMAVIAKLQTDEAFKAKMQAAFDNVKAVPAEVKDVDLAEGMELAMVQLSYLPKILAAAKKDA